METMREIILQEMNEERYNRKHIDTKIREAIEANEEMRSKVTQGVALVTEYMNQVYTYTSKGVVKNFESKNKRIAQLKSMDVSALVIDCFVGVAYSLRPELFTSVTAQMAARLGFNDRTEAITTVAELLAVLCNTDAFDIVKESKMASLMLVSRIPLGDELIRFIEESEYLPPMVCEPLELTHNHSSGYLTHNDSLILGSGNHHDGDLCLDVLNKVNRVAFKLDLKFLSTVEEMPTFELDNQEKVDQWRRFKEQSYKFYSLMAQQGNRFFFCTKTDKRGRYYCQGYHLNYQGTSFKKGMLELAHEELVQGVPT